MKFITNFSHLLLAFIFSFCCIQTGSAQVLEHKLGEFLVKLKEGKTIQAVQSSLFLLDRRYNDFYSERLIPNKNIYYLKFDPNQINEIKLKEILFDLDEIQYAQFNHLISERSTPNDELFSEQWQYVNAGVFGAVANADIDAQLAWDISTGGLTPNGDTIVVAIIDGGIDRSHEDLIDNLWFNYKEIPNNGIDDDGNGYVDDFEGYNGDDDNDNIAGGTHGTAVNGIIGAKGNNEIGVVGVNWDVKLMNIKYRAEGRDEARILKAYGYPLTQRILYNDSDGEQGAFVVVTNASWGIDFAQPSEFQLWCDIFTDLGEAGVLNCGSTINDNVDVDKEGDMPTACDSEYLITVTNLNDQSVKVNNAGFGQESIDLGAYGDLIFTTTFGSNYGRFNGTSAATPHVSGAIALLYSAPCQELADLTKSDPAIVASRIRDYILDGTKPNESLVGIAKTEGALNLFNSQSLLRNDCADSGTAPNTLLVYPNPIVDRFQIDGFDIQSNLADVKIYDSKGALLTQANNLEIFGGNLSVEGFPGLARGIYFVSIIIDGAEEHVIRISHF